MSFSRSRSENRSEKFSENGNYKINIHITNMGWRVRHVPLCRQSSWPASILHLRIQSLPCDSKRGSFVNQTSAYRHDLSYWRRNQLIAENMCRKSLWMNVKQCISVIQMERDHNRLKAVFYSECRQVIKSTLIRNTARHSSASIRREFKTKIDCPYVRCATLIIWLCLLKCLFCFCFSIARIVRFFSLDYLIFLSKFSDIYL